MATPKSTADKERVPLWREILVGVVLALAGTVVGLLTSMISTANTTCRQAIDVVIDDHANADLSKVAREAVVGAAVDRAMKCLRK